jgi:hypothetical protein
MNVIAFVKTSYLEVKNDIPSLPVTLSAAALVSVTL